MKAAISIHEKIEPIVVQSLEELDSAIAGADKDARSRDLPNIIHISTPNENCLSIVVGLDETVLCFQYGHLDPPYYGSRGASDAEKPYLTAYGSFQHHTEFSRQDVIPMSEGLAAAREFVETSELPTCVTWVEV